MKRTSNNPLKVSLRTYSLALSLSCIPALLPLISRKPHSLTQVRHVIQREVSPTGFAFAITVAIGGGRVLDDFLSNLSADDKPEGSYLNNLFRRLQNLPGYQRTLLANVLSSSLAVLLLTFKRRLPRNIPTSPIPYTVPAPLSGGSQTLDLTLVFFVRAVDSYVQSYIQSHVSTVDEADKFNHSIKRRIISKTTANLDVVLFWLASSRVMWCFFYQPDRLPKSYVKWITSLADMDSRLIAVLQAIREGSWKYGESSHKYHNLLQEMAKDLKLNPALGDPAKLPAYGGHKADRVWSSLGLKGRRGVGGVPCDLVHCGIGGNSCVLNAIFRGVRGFGQALLIYAPVHVLPPLISSPSRLVTNPLPVLLSLIRSATFLSTFISSIWFVVCCVRTLLAARLFPHISHNFWDGPQGCILAGCFVCGASIGIEKGKRRGEIALYVLPRAIRACLPDNWVRSPSWAARNTERIVFVWSLASILTAAIHKPQVLRGLSRWTLGYILEGKRSRFLPRKNTASFSGSLYVKD